MLRWIIAAMGVPVLAIAISSLHMHMSGETSRRFSYDAAAVELDRQITEQYERVPLVALLATPERYDGHQVVVSGFVTLEFEGSGLHLDENAFRAGLRQNALWLDKPKWLTSAAVKRFDRRYGEVAGTFDASEHGHLGLYSGSLNKLRRIRPTFTQSDYERWRIRQLDQVFLQELLSGRFLTLVGWMGLATLWVFTRRRS